MLSSTKGKFKSIDKGSKSKTVPGIRVSKSKPTSPGKASPEQGRTQKYAMKGLGGKNKMD